MQSVIIRIQIYGNSMRLCHYGSCSLLSVPTPDSVQFLLSVLHDIINNPPKNSIIYIKAVNNSCAKVKLSMEGKYQRRNLRKETLRPPVSAATLLLLYY